MKLFLITVFFLVVIPPKVDFKTEQLRNSRVKEAWLEKQKELFTTLKKQGVEAGSLEIFIRVFKKEKSVELWARNKNEKFVLLKSYEICATSGVAGPKRYAGDNQTPEGFYFINRFNPNSNFYLSLGVDYPNASDRILGNSKNPGGDIFIHGNCVTIGCIPITDDKIKELYVCAVEARNSGQEKIPVHIFPCRLDDEGIKSLAAHHTSEKSLVSFWENLKTGFDWFEKNRDLPKVTVLKTGRYEFR